MARPSPKRLIADYKSADVVFVCCFDEFKEVLKVDSRLGHTHFDVPGPDGKFGFGGKCFPKDTRLLLQFLKNQELDFSLMQTVLEINSKIRND